MQIDTLNLTNLLTLGIIVQKRNVAYSLESVANLTSLHTFSLYSKVVVIPTVDPLSSSQRLKNFIFRGKISTGFSHRLDIN